MDQDQEFEKKLQAVREVDWKTRRVSVVFIPKTVSEIAPQTSPNSAKNAFFFERFRARSSDYDQTLTLKEEQEEVEKRLERARNSKMPDLKALLKK